MNANEQFGAQMVTTVDRTNDLLRTMSQRGKGPKPDGATSIYTVHWHLRSDSFDGMMSRISSSPTPSRLHKHKTFVSKDKAEKLLQELLAAFKVLDYGIEGLAYIEEDWYE